MKNFVKISITVKLFQAGCIVEPHYGNVKLALSVPMRILPDLKNLVRGTIEHLSTSLYYI